MVVLAHWSEYLWLALTTKLRQPDNYQALNQDTLATSALTTELRQPDNYQALNQDTLATSALTTELRQPDNYQALKSGHISH